MVRTAAIFTLATVLVFGALFVSKQPVVVVEESAPLPFLGEIAQAHVAPDRLPPTLTFRAGGVVGGIDTTGSSVGEVWEVGDTVVLNGAGELIAVKIDMDDLLARVAGVVLEVHPTKGKVGVPGPPPAVGAPPPPSPDRIYLADVVIIGSAAVPSIVTACVGNRGHCSVDCVVARVLKFDDGFKLAFPCEIPLQDGADATVSVWASSGLVSAVAVSLNVRAK